MEKKTSVTGVSGDSVVNGELKSVEEVNYSIDDTPIVQEKPIEFWDGEVVDEAAINDMEVVVEEEEKEGVTIERMEPLELTKEIEEAILEKQAEDDIQREKNKSATVFYDNDYNKWKLIQRSANEVMGYEKATLAMPTGKSGVLVMVTDTKDSRTTISTVYIPDSKLIEENGKYFIK